MSPSTYDNVPFTHDPYRAAADRYRNFAYRRVGSSGLQLPPISLGFWYNFGDDRPFATQREIVRYAFDHGITHFDLANNYGPLYGAAEENFGRLMRKDLHAYRDELVIASKADWDMWPGPYGQLGSRKYLLASLDASLQRLGLDYVDIFYTLTASIRTHRWKRRSQRWTPRYDRGKRATWACRRIPPTTHVRPLRLRGSWARR